MISSELEVDEGCRGFFKSQCDESPDESVCNNPEKPRFKPFWSTSPLKCKVNGNEHADSQYCRPCSSDAAFEKIGEWMREIRCSVGNAIRSKEHPGDGDGGERPSHLEEFAG